MRKNLPLQGHLVVKIRTPKILPKIYHLLIRVSRGKRSPKKKEEKDCHLKEQAVRGKGPPGWFKKTSVGGKGGTKKPPKRGTDQKRGFLRFQKTKGGLSTRKTKENFEKGARGRPFELEKLRGR